MLWSNEKIYLLDLGMTGAVDARLRETLLLMLLAFSQEDASFRGDLMLSLSSQRPRLDFDRAAFKADLAALIAEYRGGSLRELRLGPLLQQVTEIAGPTPRSAARDLALIGKAFGQMQLAAAELNPSLDPLSVAGSFFLRRVLDQVRATANPLALSTRGRSCERARRTCSTASSVS